MTTILSVSFVLLFILFWNALLGRATNAYCNKTLLPFTFVNDSKYVEYNKQAFSNDTRDLVRGIQDKTDKGQSILVWISAPFQIDYTRNKIYTLTSLGLINPGLNIPITGNPDDLREYLQDTGVRYVMWQYNFTNSISLQSAWSNYLVSPFPVYRKVAENNLYFAKLLLALAKRSNIIFIKNGFVLFDLG